MRIDKNMCFVVTKDRMDKTLQNTPEECKKNLGYANKIMNKLRMLFENNNTTNKDVWSKLIKLTLYLNNNHPENQEIIQIYKYLDSKAKWEPTYINNNIVMACYSNGTYSDNSSDSHSCSRTPNSAITPNTGLRDFN